MKSVLIADDSAVVRKSLRLMFERAGWAVLSEASNGKEAVEQATEFNPDIIILDLSMPVMNGLAAALLLKTRCPILL